MKKIIFAFFILFLAFSLNPQDTFSQDTNNVLVEEFTGTWCPWCPCGHTMLEIIKSAYPNLVIICYHGGDYSSDPWWTYSSGIRGLFSVPFWPSGCVGRRTGVESRTYWYSWVVSQSVFQPGVRIEITKSYNSSTRQLDANAKVTALTNLQGTYMINFVLIESGIISYQAGNSSCPGGSSYVHNYVCKSMINGDRGDTLNYGSTWNQGDTISKGLSYSVPSGFVAENCDVVVFVYKTSSSFGYTNYVQQATQFEVETPVGIGNNGTTVSDYKLSQNYPNPFNPTTYIHFSIPKDGNTSLKFFDVLGNEVANYYDGFLKAGTYNAEFNGSTLSSGVYFYTLKAGDFVETKKMVLMK